MKHLEIYEITKFTSLNNINEDALELISRVNSHICVCEQCLERVKAYQKLQDEYTEIVLGSCDAQTAMIIDEEFDFEKLDLETSINV